MTNECRLQSACSPAARAHRFTLMWHFLGFIFLLSPEAFLLGQETLPRVTLTEVARTTLLEGPIKPLSNGVTAFGFSPDGLTLAVGMHDPDLVLLLDSETLAVRSRFKGHLGLVSRVTYLPNGNFLVSSGHDGSVRVWDVSTKRQCLLLDQFQGNVRSLAISPDGKRIYTGEMISNSKGAAQAWDVQTGQLLGTMANYNHGIGELAISPDGQTVATSSRDRTIRLWDATNFSQKFVLDDKFYWANELLFAPDGHTIVTAFDDKSIRLFDSSSLKLIHKFSTSAQVSQFITLSPNGSTLAAGDMNNVKIYHLPDGKLLSSLSDAPARIVAIQFSPDGRLIAVGGSAGFVRLYRFVADPR